MNTGGNGNGGGGVIVVNPGQSYGGPFYPNENSHHVMMPQQGMMNQPYQQPPNYGISNQNQQAPIIIQS